MSESSNLSTKHHLSCPLVQEHTCYNVVSSSTPLLATLSGGYLGAWADQGVLLLNAVLTVEKGRADSHAGNYYLLLYSIFQFLFVFMF